MSAPDLCLLIASPCPQAGEDDAHGLGVLGVAWRQAEAAARGGGLGEEQDAVKQFHTHCI